MIRFALSPAAQQDMAEIWLYTADNWGADQADRYVEGIRDVLARADPASPVVRPVDDLWRIKAGHHLCIFQWEPNGAIFAVRVLHERMEVAWQLPG